MIPLKICLVTDSLDIGGAERHVVDLARGLQGRGHTVILACSVAGPLATHLDGTEICVRPLLGRRVKRSVDVAYARRLRRLFEREAFDVVHAHLYASQAAAAAACGHTVPALIMTEHSEGAWQEEPDRMLARKFRAKSEHLIAVSPSIGDWLVATHGSGRVSVIPTALGPPTTIDLAHPRTGAPEKANGLCVGVVARLVPEKGVQVFLEAAAQVAPSLPDARFIVVGDGPLLPELRARCTTLSIDPQVHFLGWRLDARAIIANLDVLVVPSLSEGSPLVVLEALSAGIPVVASSVGDIPSRLAGGRSGVLVPPGAPGVLGRVLRDLLTHPAGLATLRSGARRWSDPVTHRAAVDRVEAIYRAALSEQAQQRAVGLVTHGRKAGRKLPSGERLSGRTKRAAAPRDQGDPPG